MGAAASVPAPRVGARAAVRRGRLPALLLAAVFLSAAPLAAQLPPEPPPRVVRLELRTDTRIDPVEDPWSLIVVQPGEPLSREEIRRSLRNLHASGLAGEIEAHLQPAEGGVIVAFALWTKIRIDEVRLEGELGLDRRLLRGALVVHGGQPLVEDRILRSVFRLQDLYREYGYLEASVRVDPRIDEGRKRATVVYRLSSGPRATVGEVRFEGETGPFSATDLVQGVRMRPGSRYRQGVAREDAERLQSWLIGKGHRLAVVRPPREEYDRGAGSLRLTFAVEVGPKVEVQVAGAELEALRKKDLLPFLGEEGYDEALVLQAVERLRRHYQEKGHYEVEIDWREERSDDRLLLVLFIEPGPVYSLTDVRLDGNRAIGDAELRQRMATAERRLLVAGSGRLVSEVLESDLDNLSSFYALQGYFRAQLGPPEVEIAGERIRLVIPIREGPQRRVVGLDFEGVESLDLGSLRRELPLSEGGPYHPVLLDQSLDALRARYEEEGYRSTQISASQDWNEDRTLVDLTIRVLEGPQTVVDRIILRGNLKTRTEVIRRSVELERGEPVSARRLLRVQRRLYQLGIFSRVEVELAPGTPYSPARDVLIRVDEGLSRRISYGAGYDSEDGVRALLGFGHANLFGRALALQFDLRASQRDRQGRLLLRQPFLGRYPVPVTYSLFRVDEMQESFDSQRWGTQVEASRFFGEDLRLGLLYTYKIVELSDVAQGLREIEVDRDLREVQISSLTPSLLFDRRDDPVSPTKGWSTNVQLEYAFPLLSADAEFLKLFAQQTGYLDLGPFGVLAASLRLGAIEPVGSAAVEDPTLPGAFRSRFIPISERFFAGGRSTHRAYKRDRLGIPAETLLLIPGPDQPDSADFEPVGGNGLLLLNLDLRFPIAGAVGGTVFFDSGNVWPDWQEIDPGEVKSGFGIGVRYLSPVGPLRLEVGWKLDREKGLDEDPFVIFLSFGNPF